MLVLHFSPLSVFLHFCRDRSLGIVQRVERRNTQGGKRGKQWAGKRGKTGMEIVGGRGKAGFAVFRDGSPGIVLTALAAPAFCPEPGIRIVWEAHRRRIVGSTQKESTAMLL